MEKNARINLLSKLNKTLYEKYMNMELARKRLNLCQGELICIECQGTGAIKSVDNSYPNTVNFAIVCPKCKGTGKLDWLEVITGKKGNWIPF